MEPVRAGSAATLHRTFPCVHTINGWRIFGKAAAFFCPFRRHGKKQPGARSHRAFFMPAEARG